MRRVAVTFEDSEGEHLGWIHGEDGLIWRVSAVISYWQHPDLGRSRLIPGQRGEAMRWQLAVVGPLPGDPDRFGEQVVTLRTYDEGTTWYMSPG